MNEDSSPLVAGSHVKELYTRLRCDWNRKANHSDLLRFSQDDHSLTEKGKPVGREKGGVMDLTPHEGGEMKKLNFQAVIKSAASAASPKTKIQESRGASGRRLGWRTTETARLPWIPGFRSSGRLR